MDTGADASQWVAQVGSRECRNSSRPEMRDDTLPRAPSICATHASLSHSLLCRRNFSGGRPSEELACLVLGVAASSTPGGQGAGAASSENKSLVEKLVFSIQCPELFQDRKVFVRETTARQTGPTWPLCRPLLLLWNTPGCKAGELIAETLSQWQQRRNSWRKIKPCGSRGGPNQP
jgi:hypothetical protein